MQKDTKKSNILNLSNKNLTLKFDTSKAKRLIFLPDYSPGKGKLPVGTVAVFDKESHLIDSDYLGPDIGCGMLLARFKEPFNLDPIGVAYSISCKLELNSKFGLGTLGGGNHFINLYEVVNSNEPNIVSGETLLLIHSGSREKGVQLYCSGLSGINYLEEHNKVVDFAMQNREKLKELVEQESGLETQTIFNNLHNYVENGEENFTYRKGAVKLEENQLGIISSSATGNAVLVRGKPKISELENSICHGTGRKISIRECKDMTHYEDEVRKKVYIPSFIMRDFLMTNDPKCYNTLEETLPLINEYVDVVGELKPKTCSQ